MDGKLSGISFSVSIKRDLRYHKKFVVTWFYFNNIKIMLRERRFLIHDFVDLMLSAIN